MTRQEFEHMIIQQKDSMYRFALSILKCNHEAEDAVQEVVLKLWKKRRSLSPDQNPASYCLNAIRNYCLDILRKNKRHLEYLNSKEHDAVEELTVEQSDLVDKIKQELDKLPLQQRMIIELKDFQGKSYEEISKIMDCNINALRVNISRARKKLFEIFKEELQDAY